MIQIDVLYENEDLVIVNKPAGLVVNRAITHSEDTMQDYIETRIDFTELEDTEESDFVVRSGIVHRLDKDTSGVLVIAKNNQTFQYMQKLFKQRDIKKEYIALIHGNLVEQKTEINAPIGRNPRERFKYAVVSGGKEALTQIEKISTVSKGEDLFTAVKVIPYTGRTHQIRVHLAAIGHSVVGDAIYSTKSQKAIALNHYSRMMLHSHCITFIDPHDQMEKKVCAPIPDEFEINI